MPKKILRCFQCRRRFLSLLGAIEDPHVFLVSEIALTSSPFEVVIKVLQSSNVAIKDLQAAPEDDELYVAI